MNEHRRFPRWQINQQAGLKLEQAEEELPCQLKDINYKGMGVVLRIKLPQDAALKISLRLSADCTFSAEVWVAWSRVINGITHYGLFFSKLRDADKNKIYRFVQAQAPKELANNWWLNCPMPAVNNERNNESGVDDNANSLPPDHEKDAEADHRIFERFPVNLCARYLNLDTGNEGLANARDVSAKGLGLIANEELKLHTALEIWLEMKDSRDPLYTRGEVVWVKKADEGSFKLGVELNKADLMGISRIFRSRDF